MKYLLMAFALMGCGNFDLVRMGTKTIDCNKKLGIVSNCETVDNSTPEPPPVAPLVLNVTGLDGNQLPPSNIAVRFANGTWQSLPFNFNSNLVAVGQCVQFNVRGKVGNKNYMLTNSNRFEMCDDEQLVLAKMNTDNDGLFDDYTVTISSSSNLYYETISGITYICREE